MFGWTTSDQSAQSHVNDLALRSTDPNPILTESEENAAILPGRSDRSNLNTSYRRRPAQTGILDFGRTASQNRQPCRNNRVETDEQIAVVQIACLLEVEAGIKFIL